MEILKQIGLSDYEIKVYTYLIDNGKSLASSIAKDLHINRSLTYSILDSLIEKGIVNYITIEKLRYFRPADPKRLLDYMEHKQQVLKDQEKIIKGLLPDLQVKFKEKEVEPEFEIYEGIDGLKNILDDILSSTKPGGEYYVIGVRGKFYQEAKHWTKHWTDRRVKKRITRKLVANKLIHGATVDVPLTEVRYLGKEYDIPLTTLIYANKVAMRIRVKKNMYTILIKSKDAFESFKKYFDLLWNIAKPQ